MRKLRKLQVRSSLITLASCITGGGHLKKWVERNRIGWVGAAIAELRTRFGSAGSVSYLDLDLLRWFECTRSIPSRY